MNKGWDFWIDRGGTFTDLVARDPDGGLHVHKLLSEAPDQYEDAPLEAIRRVLDVPSGAPLPVDRIASVKIGTTIATNALLERRGARVALLITRGFRDLLAIGYQDRPAIFALAIEKPEVLAEKTVEIDERVLADGTVRRPLQPERVREALEALRDDGFDSVAVLLLHSFAYPEHETRIGVIADDLGFPHISLSHAVAGEIKAVSRGDTTVADAYLTPLLRAYATRLREALGETVRLRFMQSNGGLTDAERFRGKDAVLSGPAGGVVAGAHVSRLAGFNRIIGFDMGGTSTDVSRYDGAFDRVYETCVAGIRLKAPMMAIHTVAAGGGSILRFEQGRFVVGPESAGADPGPACYGRGGPATVTDANAVLGRVAPAYFPAVFGPNADAPLDVEASRTRLAELRRAVQQEIGEDRRLEAVAAGFVRIANENMAQAIKEISVAKGYDVRDYALVCFGGAGAQHACAIASSLGIRSVLLHPFAGVLSAYGIGLANTIHADVEAVLQPLEEPVLAALDERYRAMERAHADALADEGFDDVRIAHRREIDLRYVGVESALTLPLEEENGLRDAFETRHGNRYGFTKPNHPIEIVNIRSESVGRADRPEERRARDAARGTPDPVGRAPVWFANLRGDAACHDAPIYSREDLAAGARIAGPALVTEETSTIVIDPGWRGEINAYGHLVLTATAPGERLAVPGKRDPVLLEVFNNLFMSIATQMGETLERVSHSANIKERLDFSCAVFSPDGELVANAPHIPVHLGAMQESVRALLDARRGGMRPGDAFLTNDPYHGGSHLPDLTVVTPVFRDGDTPEFFVANRGHHVDIGGVAPGSMPPFSASIEEEGVLIHDFQLVSEGVFRETELVGVLSRGPYPARNIPERLSDLRAQLAANKMGVGLLGQLCDTYGLEGVRAYMRHVRDNAAETMRATLAALPEGRHEAEEIMDSGATVACSVTLDAGRAIVDFGGSSPQQGGNLNAPRAVTVAAVLYVLRTLVARSVPLNAGCLDPVDIRIPPGSMLDPRYPAAVVGGNVEVSQRIVDAVFRALGVLAASQGTMNNMTFGTAEWGYYETLGGGAGAGAGVPGAAAVQVHMTNTRMTDVEVLERRYPVVASELAIRLGSGGAGEWSGGDGLVRGLEFREAVTLGLLTDRRNAGAPGLYGGASGIPGRNLLIRNGHETVLEGHALVEIVPGDIVRIETPGGGGFGRE